MEGQMTKLIALFKQYRRKFWETDAEMYARIDAEVKAKLQKQFPSCYVGDL